MPVDLNAMLEQSMIDLANTSPADSLAVTNSLTKALATGAQAQTAANQQLGNVQIDAANRAEILQSEAANATFKATNDVLAMWNNTQQATALGIQQSKDYLMQATTLEAEAQQLEDEAPSLFKNPLAAITMKWKAASKQVEAEDKRGTAHRMLSNINSMLQISRTQMEDTIAANSLYNNALIDKRATELDDGIAQARAQAEVNYNNASIMGKASADIATAKRGHLDWLQEQSRILIAQGDAAMRAKEFDLNRKKWLADEKQRNMLEQNLQNVAYSIALTRKGSEPTESEVIAARGMAEALFKQDPATFGQFSMYGNEIKSMGATLGFASALNKGTVGLVRSLGDASGNAQLKNFGVDLYTQQYATTVEGLYQERARKANIDPTNQQEFEMWKRRLGSGEKTSIEKQAREIAENTVRDMPITSYMQGKTERYSLPSNGINTIALGDAASVQHYYGFKVGTKENAALASPELRAIIQQAQASNGVNGLVAGAASAMDWMKKAGVKNPAKVLAKVYGNAIEGIIQENDPEYKFLRSNVRVKPRAKVQLDDATYDMADEIWLERAVQRFKNPPKSIAGWVKLGASEVFAAGRDGIAGLNRGATTVNAGLSLGGTLLAAPIGSALNANGNMLMDSARNSALPADTVTNAINSGVQFKESLINTTTDKISQFAVMSDAIRAERAAALTPPSAPPVRTQMAADGSIVGIYADGTQRVVTPPPKGNAPQYNLQTMPTVQQPTVQQAAPQLPNDPIIKQEQLADGTIYTVYKSGRTNYKAPAPSYNLQTMPEPHLRNLWNE